MTRDDPRRDRILYAVPLRSNIPDQGLVNATMQLPSGISFAEGIRRICQRTRIPMEGALFAWKFSDAAARDPPIALYDEADWREMETLVLRKMRGARTRTVIVSIINVVSCVYHLHSERIFLHSNLFRTLVVMRKQLLTLILAVRQTKVALFHLPPTSVSMSCKLFRITINAHFRVIEAECALYALMVHILSSLWSY